MGVITATRIAGLEVTLQELLDMSVLELAGLTLYDASGNSSDLPRGDVTREVDQAIKTAQYLKAVAESLADIKTGKIVDASATYVYLYADVAGTPTYLPYATKTVSPRPATASQIRLTKNGHFMAPSTWTWGASGITLDTALTIGDVVLLEVLSEDAARGRYVFEYNGTYATPNGITGYNTDLVLASLTADLKSELITKFPSSSNYLNVYLNGLRVSASAGLGTPDYSLTGTGQATVITFTNALTSSDTITLEIWSTL